MDDVTLLVKRKRPTLLRRLGLGPQDVPYVVIISLCMAVSFMSGRMSAAPGTAPEAPHAVTSYAASASPVPVLTVPLVVPLQALPEDVPPPPPETAMPPQPLPPPSGRAYVRQQLPPPAPAPAPAKSAAVVPEKIELEEEPVNPYRSRMQARSSGF